MKKIYFLIALFSILVSACTLTSTSPSNQGPKQAVGTVTGMVLGGKIAKDLTEDSSKRNLWTLAGVTLGAFLGNEIGASMDKTDILMAQNARNYALENNKASSQSAWENPDSGNSGVIYPTKTYSRGDQPCREFTQEINIGGIFRLVTARPVEWQMEAGNSNRYLNKLLGYIQIYEIASDSMGSEFNSYSA